MPLRIGVPQSQLRQLKEKEVEYWGLTLFVPGFFHFSMTGGGLIGRTPQKSCRLIEIILLVLFLGSFIFLLPKNKKKVKFTSKIMLFGPFQYDRLSKNGKNC
jgi:hypothetical protein